ncbi:hypothetical protein HAX54_035823 [Datura stramonium]|uniref:Uncharacterized protein n=1 Tax=Datura stramonium TaxID=4076 RepID=A0ABS8RMQ5_DATST|nr:hypothetical protein [Datura stramonium]
MVKIIKIATRLLSLDIIEWVFGASLPGWIFLIFAVALAPCILCDKWSWRASLLTQTRSKEIVKNTRSGLKSVCTMLEDTVESFALGVDRQKKKWGFLMNRSMVLKNLMVCQKLRRKMKRIPSDIEQAIHKKPKDREKSYDGKEPEEDRKPLRCTSDKSLMFDREKQAKLLYTNSYNEEELEIFVSQIGTTLSFYHSNTADPMWSNSLHNLERPSEKYCWSLFLKKAGLDTWEEGKEQEDLKQQILGVCKSYPLILSFWQPIVDQGAGENQLDYLQEILKSQTNFENEDIVSLSYTDLPYHLKLSVLYLVLFPKEYDIPVRRLQVVAFRRTKLKPDILPGGCGTREL